MVSPILLKIKLRVRDVQLRAAQVMGYFYISQWDFFIFQHHYINSSSLNTEEVEKHKA
jgi:hypothetical protein